MVALYTCWYNFVKMHRMVGMTPATAANVTKAVDRKAHTYEALVSSVRHAEPSSKKRRRESKGDTTDTRTQIDERASCVAGVAKSGNGVRTMRCGTPRGDGARRIPR